MSDKTTQITELEDILDAGAKRVSVDGVTVDYDLEHTERRLRQLKQQDNSRRGRRPVASQINLGG